MAYSLHKNKSIAYYFQAGKRITFQGEWDQFFSLPYGLASPALTSVTSIMSVCLLRKNIPCMNALIESPRS
jgi:hypothetical protein